MDGRDRERLDGSGWDVARPGWGVSLDQVVHPMITLFARYGYEDPDVFEIARYWSCGGQVKGFVVFSGYLTRCMIAGHFFRTAGMALNLDGF